MATFEGTDDGRGEHLLQARYGTKQRAEAFYGGQVLDHLNEEMREFVGRMEMLFVATADADGHCDCSFRAGSPGFIRLLDERTLAYPEYRGNGVMASLGNIVDNPHIGLVMFDFFGSTIGLHINGRATVVANEDMLNRAAVLAEVAEEIATPGGRHPERWVLVEVDEAYVHCSKHVPLLAKLNKTIAWGTDDQHRKGGDYFHVSRQRRRLRETAVLGKTPRTGAFPRSEP